MENQKNSSHNFWSGYALGALSGAVFIYAFATKKGRDTMLKMLKHTDTLENNFEEIVNLIQKKVIPAEKNR